MAFSTCYGFLESQKPTKGVDYHPNSLIKAPSTSCGIHVFVKNTHPSHLPLVMLFTDSFFSPDSPPSPMRRGKTPTHRVPSTGSAPPCQHLCTSRPAAPLREPHDVSLPYVQAPLRLPPFATLFPRAYGLRAPAVLHWRMAVL